MSADTQTVVAEPKPAPTSKTRKARPHASRPAAMTEKLVCSYCGSDDLAPSFKKRRDARCRACFKKRYGSAARKKGSAAPEAKKERSRPAGAGDHAGYFGEGRRRLWRDA